MKMYAVFNSFGTRPHLSDVPVVFKRNSFGSKFCYTLGFTVFEDIKNAERAEKSLHRQADKRGLNITTSVKEVEVDVQNLW